MKHRPCANGVRMATATGIRPTPKYSSDIDSIWKTAVTQYEQLTGTRLYAATGPTTLEDVWNEISQTNSNFQSFRHNSDSKINKIRIHVVSALTPIGALGEVVAHATKAVRNQE
jgi:hypothetical protein